MDGRTDGKTDGLTLFYRTLPAEAGGPKTAFLIEVLAVYLIILNQPYNR